MPKTQPTIIKVGSKGAYVNLNSIVTAGMTRGQVHRKLKDGYEGDPKAAKEDDIVEYTADTASFYFIGRDELVLRVGFEITQEEFEAIEAIVDEVTYHARVTTPDETPQGA